MPRSVEHLEEEAEREGEKTGWDQQAGNGTTCVSGRKGYLPQPELASNFAGSSGEVGRERKTHGGPMAGEEERWEWEGHRESV